MSERTIEYLPIDQIREAPRNPKEHDEDGIAGSITEFDFAEAPLLDERTGRLIAGHGRLKALKTLRDAGKDAPGGIRVTDDGTWLLPVQRGWSSRDDHHADAYLLASNQLGMNGAWNEEELEAVLKDLANADFDLSLAAGFDAADLEEILAGDEEPIVHDDLPATAAAFAETPEQEAERRARIEQYGARNNPDAPADDRQPADDGGREPGDPWDGATPAGQPDTPAAPETPAAPRPTGAMQELPLAYTPDDRREVARLIGAARSVLGAHLSASETVLRGLRVLVAVLDERDNPTPVDCGSIAKRAGWEPEQ